MKRLSFVLTFVLFQVSFAAGQTATVRRNVNIRPDASTNGTPVAKLTTGAEVELLEPDQTNGFLHVKTVDGIEGWAWSKNLQIQTANTSASTIGPNAEHVGPASLYPDPTMTPGLAATLSVNDLTKAYTDSCPGSKRSCTYSQDHRNVPASVHKKVYDEYSVPQAERNIRTGEVDHFYPLCAGGSNDISNLWYQPAVNEWNGKEFGYHEKDKLETLICAQIKDHKLDPHEAYDKITKDWVRFYLDEGLDDQN
jgi:hypothetical protein